MDTVTYEELETKLYLKMHELIPGCNKYNLTPNFRFIFVELLEQITKLETRMEELEKNV